MINTTDLSECEVLLPGDWLRKDNGDLYSFTVDKMEIIDDRLFRQLIIRHLPEPAGTPSEWRDPTTSPEPPVVQALRYALIIKDEFCGVRIEDEDFIIKEIAKKGDGAYMEWEDDRGRAIAFESQPPQI